MLRPQRGRTPVSPTPAAPPCPHPAPPRLPGGSPAPLQPLSSRRRGAQGRGGSRGVAVRLEAQPGRFPPPPGPRTPPPRPSRAQPASPSDAAGGLTDGQAAGRADRRTGGRPCPRAAVGRVPGLGAEGRRGGDKGEGGGGDCEAPQPARSLTWNGAEARRCWRCRRLPEEPGGPRGRAARRRGWGDGGATAAPGPASAPWRAARSLWRLRGRDGAGPPARGEGRGLGAEPGALRGLRSGPRPPPALTPSPPPSPRRRRSQPARSAASAALPRPPRHRARCPPGPAPFQPPAAPIGRRRRSPRGDWLAAGSITEREEDGLEAAAAGPGLVERRGAPPQPPPRGAEGTAGPGRAAGLQLEPPPRRPRCPELGALRRRALCFGGLRPGARPPDTCAPPRTGCRGPGRQGSCVRRSGMRVPAARHKAGTRPWGCRASPDCWHLLRGSSTKGLLPSERANVSPAWKKKKLHFLKFVLLF